MGADISALEPEVIVPSDGEAFFFSSLEEMVAASEVVVMGRVVGIERGRQSGAEGDDPGIGVRDARIEVDVALKGDPGDEIVLEELGFDREGQPFEVAHQPWSLVGDKGNFFLIRTPAQPANHYQLVADDGRLLFEGRQTMTWGRTRCQPRCARCQPPTWSSP